MDVSMETVRLEIRVPAEALDYIWSLLEGPANDISAAMDSNEIPGTVAITNTLGESDDYR